MGLVSPSGSQRSRPGTGQLGRSRSTTVTGKLVTGASPWAQDVYLYTITSSPSSWTTYTKPSGPTVTRGWPPAPTKVRGLQEAPLFVEHEIEEAAVPEICGQFAPPPVKCRHTT